MLLQCTSTEGLQLYPYNYNYSYIYQARTETYRNSFFPKTTINWNHLPYPDLHEIDLRHLDCTYLIY